MDGFLRIGVGSLGKDRARYIYVRVLLFDESGAAGSPAHLLSDTFAPLLCRFTLFSDTDGQSIFDKQI